MSRKGAARSKATAGGGASSAAAGKRSDDSVDSPPIRLSATAGNGGKSRDGGGGDDDGAQVTLLGLTTPVVTKLVTYARVRRVLVGLSLVLLVYSLWLAYDIRMISVRLYGYLIHEFDPWFNFRAAQYMDEHGWSAFFNWFDMMSWYPIGRHVGATTYPGMQITAVALHRVLDAVGIRMSLNDICVLIPAWFGVTATLILGAMAYEVTASPVTTAIAMATFAIIPAHTMRSMAGEFDNECIAMTAMLLTFYMWVRALRTSRSWPMGVLVGLAYGYMVAAWGGFIFVLNMIALHASVCAAFDWLHNTYSASLLYAYTLFFVVGTAIAVRVPPVGMAPFKSLEQIAGVLVLVALWTLHLSELLRRRACVPVRSRATLRLRMRVMSMMVVALTSVALVLAPTNYFGPMTSRVRALFVQHTLTGNPLVDSVAEHQQVDASAYLQFLHIIFPLWLMGTSVLLFTNARNARGALFVLLYSATAYYFSTRMSRLMIFAGPVASICGANTLGHMVDFVVNYLFWRPSSSSSSSSTHGNDADAGKKSKGNRSTATSSGSCSAARLSHHADGSVVMRQGSIVPVSLYDLLNIQRMPHSRVVAVVLLGLLVLICVPTTHSFTLHARAMATAMGSPRIVTLATSSQTGERVLIDDYLQSYLWLKNNTPSDARVLSWWDYGYQITGIGNRTTLADGNTWHHEHIATVGKMLVAPVKEAHALIRHVADYVLVWTGQNADDLMKSHHMVRISNSVYHDTCQGDPACQFYGWSEHGRPSPRMRQSLLYNLHGVGLLPDAHVSRDLFREVYRSRYGLVRIFQVMNVSAESKAWVADPANRVCRPPPESWWCEGQFPPAPEIQAVLARRVNYGKAPTPEQLRWLRDFHSRPPMTAATQRRYAEPQYNAKNKDKHSGGGAAGTSGKDGDDKLNG